MLPDLESGGVERGTVEMAAYLVRNGHRSWVVSAGGRLVTDLENEGSRHVTLPVGKKNLNSLMCLPRLRKLLVQQRVDILHLRSRVPAWVGFLAVKTLPINRRPRVVTTFHGFYSINAYSAIMAKGERVIAVSNTISDHIQTEYHVPEARIKIIYRGVDQNRFSPDKTSSRRVDKLRQAWKLQDCQGPVLLIPARITRLKGHDLLVHSLDKIRHLPWVAICAGEFDNQSSYVKALNALIRKMGLQDRIKMVGHCSDMPAALMLSDLVISASTQPESFGRIAIEAQAMGKPVIATAHGGSLETVRDRYSGWHVPPGNEAALAQTLSEAVRQPQLRQTYGRNASNWVRLKFTLDNMCRDTVSVYYDLLENHRDSWISI
jgi:glycosyltransferase involved in cell wall biosynthesis